MISQLVMKAILNQNQKKIGKKDHGLVDKVNK